MPQNKGEIENYLQGIVQNLPERPGCYQYLDEEGDIIYVGKAKNLKRRVSSYFNKHHEERKLRLLVAKIRDIRYVVVNSEEDALLLENNLIKAHQPRYNVLLKDDKTYPSIAVSGEYLPRVFKTRKRGNRSLTYFGPYSHVPTMYALLDLCKKLYQPRPCRIPMTKEGIASGKYKVCLNYHIHRCGAPCVGKQSREAYLRNIEACKEILKGNTQELQRQMREEMVRLSEDLRFEEAQKIKLAYEQVERFKEKSRVVSNVLHNIDVFHIESQAQVAFINYLHVKNGCITQAFTFEYKKRLDESDEELLTLGIVEMRSRYGSNSKEIVVPFHVDLPDEMVVQTIPQKGDKRKLLDLSKLNVKQYQFDRLKQAEKLNPEQKQVRLMKEIQAQLGLESLPLHIELFDNSNISGDDAVASCVVFEKLLPKKKDYRKYLLRTVSGPDDYASMKEVVRRRYASLKETGAKLPDLIIADGGKGQMKAIREVTQGELGLEIPIAGLAKDSRHRTRELLFGFPPKTIGLKPDSQLFKTLARMQDEVHRFAVTFHRAKRSKRQTASLLDGIRGIGPITKEKLLKRFHSVKQIREASAQELQEVLGKGRGEKLFFQLRASENVF